MVTVPDIKSRLMAPGPVMMPPAVMECLSEPMVHHRTPEFTEILNSVLSRLPRVFGTDQPVMMLSSTGSGAMEAAIVNTLKSSDHILVIESGKFGQRWASMAETYGVKVDRIEVEWGTPVTLEQIQQKFSKQNYDALLTQASETSTATWNPVGEIGSWLKANQPDCLFIVDGITSVAATELGMDNAGIDAYVAGSQKAFMLPTGLSFVALSKKAWERSAQSDLPKFYLDLKKERAANEKGQTLFSSNVTLIRALKLVLDQWDGDGLNQHVKTMQTQHRALLGVLEKLGLQLLSSSPSPTVTAIKVPDGIDGAKLRQHVEDKYQCVMMGGQEQLKGKIVRIGHLGFIQAEDLYACVYFLIQGLKDMGHDIAESTVEEALYSLRSDLGLS